MRSLKNITFSVAILASMGVVSIMAQDKHPAAGGVPSPCSLKFTTFSYIAPTTQKKPLEEVTVELRNTATKDVFRATTKDGAAFFESIEDGVYQVVSTKDGHRKSQDLIRTECSKAMNGSSQASIPMWEGDTIKTVDYSQARKEEVLGKSPAGQEPKDPKVNSVTKYNISDAAPVDGADRSGKVLNYGAIVLAKPQYPPMAKAVGASGAVHILITIDEDGYVIAAKGVEGHALLRPVAAEAARASRFMPTSLDGKPVKVTGIIVFNFQ